MTSEPGRHAVEQSFVAVRALAVGGGDVAARLEEAADALLSVESKDLPPALQAEFAALITELMAIEDFEGLPEADAATFALRILLVHEKVLLSQRAE